MSTKEAVKKLWERLKTFSWSKSAKDSIDCGDLYWCACHVCYLMNDISNFDTGKTQNDGQVWHDSCQSINLNDVHDENEHLRLEVLGIILDGSAHSTSVRQVQKDD